MAEKNKIEKRMDKNSKVQQNVLQKISASATKIGKKAKSFFVNLKAELKRVVWPDKKRLIQNTATVLAICVIAGIILFIVDSVLGGVLEGVGFYSPSATTTQTSATTTATTAGETSATSIEETTAATTTGAASEATTETAAG